MSTADVIDTAAGLTCDLQAIGERRTDRRRFTSWPVSFEQVQDLCQVAADRAVTAVPVVDLAEATAQAKAQIYSRKAQPAVAAEAQQVYLKHGSRHPRREGAGHSTCGGCRPGSR
mgnify:CR=1 FL=1